MIPAKKPSASDPDEKFPTKKKENITIKNVRKNTIDSISKVPFYYV